MPTKISRRKRLAYRTGKVGAIWAELHDQAERNRKNQSRANGFLPIGRYNVFMSDGQKSLLYARVETVLAKEISDGDLKIGDQLPTEDSLVARFGVSEPRPGRNSSRQRHNPKDWALLDF